MEVRSSFSILKTVMCRCRWTRGLYNLDLILDGPGRISAELAKKKVRQVFSEYKEKQRHLEKIESLKELEHDLSEYRRSYDCI